MAKQEETYCKFTKYDRNIQHAMAVSSIGSKINYWIDDVADDIKRTRERIEERVNEQMTTEDWNASEDWQLRNLEQDLLNYQEMLSLWKKLDSVLEKELAF